MTMAMAANNLKAQKEEARLQDIDTRVAAIMTLDAQIKELQNKLKEMKVEFASDYFVEENGTAEEITGNEYQMKKTPVLTKKTYDTKALKVLLEAAGVEVKTVKTVLERKMVTNVNEKELGKLVKSGIITEDMVSKTISGNMNYKMLPSRMAE